MRVGLLTSYNRNEKAVAYTTLPIMKRYCSIRGYTLVVGQGMSADGMFEGVNPYLDPQFATATLFVPIWTVIVDPRVKFQNGGIDQRTPPEGLAVLCSSIEEVRATAAKAPWLGGLFQ